MKPYQYGMEPDVEMRPFYKYVPPPQPKIIDFAEGYKWSPCCPEVYQAGYYGWQWAIVHGSKLTASGSGKDEAEAYRETCDAFNLGLKLIAEAN